MAASKKAAVKKAPPSVKTKASVASPNSVAPAAGANSTQPLPPNNSLVGSAVQFTDAGAALNMAQGPGSPTSTNDSPLQNTDGVQQYVYTTTAPLIPAGNPYA
jgi:hypothetical protein